MDRNTNLIRAEVQAQSIARHAADLSSDISHAAYDDTGTYAECVFEVIGRIRENLAIVEAEMLEHCPKARKGEAQSQKVAA